MCLALPGKIESIGGDGVPDGMGRVNFGGVVKQVSLVCVPEAKVGEYVIVHAGIAISTLDEKEAIETILCLNEMGEQLEREEKAP